MFRFEPIKHQFDLNLMSHCSCVFGAEQVVTVESFLVRIVKWCSRQLTNELKLLNVTMESDNNYLCSSQQATRFTSNHVIHC